MPYQSVKLRTSNDKFISGDLYYTLSSGSKGRARMPNGDPGYPGEAPEIKIDNFEFSAYYGGDIWVDYMWCRGRDYLPFVKALALKLAKQALDKDQSFYDDLLQAAERDND